MAALRGSTKIWKGVSVTTNDVSDQAYIGSGTAVTIFIKNAGSNTATFTVQVADLSGDAPGMNALDATTSGGVDWYDYQGVVGQTVAGGKNAAFDLSPFAPQILRVICTNNGGGANTITAFVTCNG